MAPSSHAAPRPSERAPFALRGRVMRAPGAPMEEGAVVVAGGRVVAMDSPPIAARLPPRCLDAAFISPGFVDLQVNGGFGFEVGTDPQALHGLAEHLPRTGVTTFLPTLVSRAEARYQPAFAAFRAATAAPRPVGAARMPGLHLEGPLLARSRAGAHDETSIAAATAAMVERLADPDIVRMVTLASERDGALPLIARLRARGVVVALGHTDATFDEFTAGVDAGATLATHLFNAMAPFHHRAPGAVGAALTDARITALVIADGVHAHPAALRLAARAKGRDHLGLVTDAIAGAGLLPGPSALAGRAIVVDGRSARLADGRLAGSTLTLDQAVRNAVAYLGCSAATAIHWATAVPGRFLDDDRPAEAGAGWGSGAGAGQLGVGCPADLVLLDDALTVRATFIAGELVYARDPDDPDIARALQTPEPADDRRPER